MRLIQRGVKTALMQIFDVYYYIADVRGFFLFFRARRRCSHRASLPLPSLALSKVSTSCALAVIVNKIYMKLSANANLFPTLLLLVPPHHSVVSGMLDIVLSIRHV